MSIGWGLAITVLLLALNAFFVAGEFATTSSRRSQIEPLRAEGARGSAQAMYALEHVSLMLAICQLGVTVASTTLGVVAEPAIAHLVEGPSSEPACPPRRATSSASSPPSSSSSSSTWSSARWSRRTSRSPIPRARSSSSRLRSLRSGTSSDRSSTRWTSWRMRSSAGAASNRRRRSPRPSPLRRSPRSSSSRSGGHARR